MNKEIAQALRAAKEHLWDGVDTKQLRTYLGNLREEFICHAIYVSGHAWANTAWAFVTERLDGHNEFAHYHDAQPGMKRWRDMSSIEQQAARHQWLDELIAELESVT